MASEGHRRDTRKATVSNCSAYSDVTCVQWCAREGAVGGGNATAEATKVPFLGLDRTNMPVSFAAFASLTTVLSVEESLFFFFSALPPVLQDFRCTPLPLWYVQIKQDMRVTVFIICFLICFKGLNVKKNILLRLLRSTSPIHLVLCKLMLKSTCIKCNIKPQSLILCFFFI